MFQLLDVGRLLPGSLCLHRPLVRLLVEEYLSLLDVLEQPRESNLRRLRSHIGGRINVSPNFLDYGLVRCAYQSQQFGL